MRLLALLSLLCCGPLTAADVSLRIVVIPRSSDETPIHLSLGDKTQKIEAASNALSGPLKVAAQAKWDFGTTENGSFQSLGSAPAGKGTHQLIILCRQGEATTDGLSVLVIDNAEKQFRGGTFLVANLTETTVSGEIGDRSLDLGPVDHVILKPKPDEDGLCHASLESKAADADRPRSILSTTWPVDKEARNLILVFKDPRRDKVRVHTVQDLL